MQAYHLAAYELRQRVDEAFADGPLRSGELDQLARFIDNAGLDEASTERLDTLLRSLVAAPQHIEPRNTRKITTTALTPAPAAARRRSIALA